MQYFEVQIQDNDLVKYEDAENKFYDQTGATIEITGDVRFISKNSITDYQAWMIPDTIQSASTIISKYDFLHRFTSQERISIRNMDTTTQYGLILDDFLYLLELATVIDLTSQETIQGIFFLETIGLIAHGRADQILQG